MQVYLNSNIFNFLLLTKNLPKLFQSAQNICLNKKLNKDKLKTDFLYCLLKGGIRQNNIITISIYKQNVLILDLCMSSSNACVF